VVATVTMGTVVHLVGRSRGAYVINGSA
jgi:hypothetical protein